MFNPEIFAMNLARSVELLRTSPPNKEQQKASLRAVFALTSLASATLRLYDGVLSVDDRVLKQGLPFTDGLKARMEAHGVAEIAIGRGTSATELLALLKALAVDVGGFAPGDGVRQRLEAAGAEGIAVICAPREPESAGPRAPSVTQAFDMAAIEEAEAMAIAAQAEPEPDAAPAELEAAVAEPGAAATEPEALEAPEAPVAEKVEAEAEAAEEAEAQGVAEAEPREAAEPEAVAGAVPEELESPHGVPADTPLGAALNAVVWDPYGGGILDRLSELESEVGTCLREGRLEHGVQAIAAVIGLEPGAPDGTPRNSYGIVMRRILTRDAIERISRRMLPDPRFTPLASAVVQRAGAEASEVLAELVATSELPSERKAFLLALRSLPQGKAALTQLLGRSQWVVVRNVAELLGEVQFEEAVPELGKLLSHGQPRVRRAAAVALAKIGSVATVEPLRRAMREGTPELRALVATSIGGSRARALAMPLVTLAEAEEDEEVLCEYYRALGRIASPEAVDALAKAARPGGRIFGRRPAAPRIAAIEGLRSAGGALAIRTLEELRGDSDKVVREAVQRALDNSSI